MTDVQIGFAIVFFMLGWQMREIIVLKKTIRNISAGMEK